MMIYGPYNCSDGRRRVIHDGKTKLYARYLIELKTGRELTNKEQVNHIDGNFKNDDIENLEILLTTVHLRSHQQEYYEVAAHCIECLKVFMMSAVQHRNRVANIKRGKTRGPFCSKKCSGKYSQRNYFHSK
jgi:hypothetical protein